MAPRKTIIPSSGSGGRAPTQADKVSRKSMLPWTASPPSSDEARLTIIQVTDVYTLANFASLKNLIKDTKAKSGDGGKVVSMLTGDFLAPYVLSSVDRGVGMMNAIAKTPIDYLTWGNHEADMDHRTVCTHVKNFPGTWINTNMQSHAAMEYQKPFDIIEVTSPDGSQTRKIGLIGILSNGFDLYRHFPPPGAFGGAKILDPWETIAEYKALLEGPEHNCDMVIPLQHLYVPDDHKTCRDFDFPIILSGHDHHRVDETVEGTRLLKPGLDAVYATVVDISWPDSSEKEPIIAARFVKVDNWEPDEQLQEECEMAYDALIPLRKSELAAVPEVFRPLSSHNARGSLTTMGRMVCSILRSALNTKHAADDNSSVDAVILMGGYIRGNSHYPPESFFSLGMLEAEVGGDDDVAVVSMPGWLLSDGIAETHSTGPRPGWFQYDVGIEQEEHSKGAVTMVGGKPIDRNRRYRVATKISALTNTQSKPFTEYYTAHPEELPPKGAYVNIHAEILTYFARNVWRKIWDGIAEKLEGNVGVDERLSELDLNNDGEVSVEEIHVALKDIAGFSTHEDKLALAKYVHSFADISGDGKLTLEDLIMFDEEIEKLVRNERKERFSFREDVASWALNLGGSDKRRTSFAAVMKK